MVNWAQTPSLTGLQQLEILRVNTMYAWTETSGQ